LLKLLFLGTSAARPTVERSVSALAVVREGETLLFECGEGTQRQMMRYGVGFSLSDIFFSHFHGDHFLGVIGLVRTLGLQGRTDPLRCYGPKGAKRLLTSALSLGVERVPFEVEIVELEADSALHRGEYDILTYAADHGSNALGYVLVEKDRLGRFEPARANEAGVPEGPLWGRLQRGEAVQLEDGRIVEPDAIVGAPRPGRKVVYTGDTRPCKATIEAAIGTDVLVHEATFSMEEADRAKETDHSTAHEAAEVARMARARRLVLTHVSARYSRDAGPLLEEAQSIFPETVVARDGMEIDVPFRE
jgi:ribonuclease Z